MAEEKARKEIEAKEKAEKLEQERAQKEAEAKLLFEEEKKKKEALEKAQAEAA